MWANQPPNSKPNWGRNGEPGSAFRGMSRGRPGRGGGRGGRGGRGGGRGTGAAPPRIDDKGPKLNGSAPPKSSQGAAPSPSAPPAAPTTSTPVNDAPSTAKAPANKPKENKESKPPARKTSEAKPPRKLPPIIVEPPQVSSTASPTSATTPNRSRRKRSQNRSTSSMSMSSKKSPSSESSTSLLRPEKSPIVAKDLPPHLAPPPLPETPSFDIKHDIDALVERVRAVAMDRPNTPGSHIDWAGDDDDSLPDLDDWGVKSIPEKNTTSVAGNQQDLISPILAGALKPLPNIGSPLAASSSIPPPPSHVLDEPAVVASVPVKVSSTTAGVPSNSGLDSGASVKGKPASKAAPVEVNGKWSESVAEPIASAPQPATTKGSHVKKSPLKQTTAPLHPSLPAKPVGAIDALSKKVPRKPVPPVETPDNSTSIDAPLNSGGLSESMHAPKPDDILPPVDATPTINVPPESQGVSASIHAPARSAPSHITAHAMPASSSVPTFHPTHGRAHTIGRPAGLRVPFSPSQNSLLDGADERAARRDHRERVNHARTHSSPPTGPGTSTAHARGGHAARPVITVDALSKLARTLGGAPGPKTKPAPPAPAAPVAASKE